MAERPDFDSLVDSVAQRMTAGDPPIRLRAKVLARLDERRPMPWLSMTAAVCALGVAVAAVAIGLHHRVVPQVAPDAQAGAMKPTSNAPLASSQILSPGPEPQAPSLQPRIVRREPGVSASVPSAEESAWRSRVIPALEPPDALTLNEIQPAPLEIRPLVTTPLAVPAIGEEDEDTNQKGPRP